MDGRLHLLTVNQDSSSVRRDCLVVSALDSQSAVPDSNLGLGVTSLSGVPGNQAVHSYGADKLIPASAGVNIFCLVSVTAYGWFSCSYWVRWP